MPEVDESESDSEADMPVPLDDISDDELDDGSADDGDGSNSDCVSHKNVQNGDYVLVKLQQNDK